MWTCGTSNWDTSAPRACRHSAEGGRLQRRRIFQLIIREMMATSMSAPARTPAPTSAGGRAAGTLSSTLSWASRVGARGPNDSPAGAMQAKAPPFQGLNVSASIFSPVTTTPRQICPTPPTTSSTRTVWNTRMPALAPNFEAIRSARKGLLFSTPKKRPHIYDSGGCTVEDRARHWGRLLQH